MPRRATVHVKQVGPNSWQVSSAALKPRYRKAWPSEIEANRDAERIRRQLAGVGLEASQMRSVEACLHRLATVESPGRGKSLEFAVEWFLRHYRPAGEKTVAEYAADYQARKKLKLEDKSMVELKSYLDAFSKEFGHLPPLEIGADQLESYLAANTSRYYRDKVLRSFFRWLTGVTSAKIAKLQNPPLERNPFDYVERVDYEKANPTEILSYGEVLRVLNEAKARGVLPWFIWGLFTGMRPEAEAKPFWSLEGHGWSQIDIERGIICVTDDLEKTGTRTRDIVIQPNLKEWLLWFKAQGVQPAYSRRKIRAVFKAAAPRRNAQDLLRHTFISFACKIMAEHDVTYQAATSSRMIKKHYRRMVPESEVKLFWGIVPSTLGL